MNAEGSNPPNENLAFYNTVWSDIAGKNVVLFVNQQLQMQTVRATNATNWTPIAAGVNGG